LNLSAALILNQNPFFEIGSIAYPQTASFGPERRFRNFGILEIARYACGLKISQALL